MSLYTGYGDKGYTYTKLSAKTPKNHSLVNFLGNLDELNCFLGYLFSSIKQNENLPVSLFEKIMAKCFEIGAFLGYNSNLCFEKMDIFISYDNRATFILDKEVYDPDVQKYYNNYCARYVDFNDLIEEYMNGWIK